MILHSELACSVRGTCSSQSPGQPHTTKHCTMRIIPIYTNRSIAATAPINTYNMTANSFYRSPACVLRSFIPRLFSTEDLTMAGFKGPTPRLLSRRGSNKLFWLRGSCVKIVRLFASCVRVRFNLWSISTYSYTNIKSLFLSVWTAWSCHIK